MTNILFVQIFIHLVFSLASVFLPLMALWIPTSAVLHAISPSRSKH